MRALDKRIVFCAGVVIALAGAAYIQFSLRNRSLIRAPSDTTKCPPPASQAQVSDLKIALAYPPCNPLNSLS